MAIFRETLTTFLTAMSAPYSLASPERANAAFSYLMDDLAPREEFGNPYLSDGLEKTMLTLSMQTRTPSIAEDILQAAELEPRYCANRSTTVEQASCETSETHRDIEL